MWKKTIDINVTVEIPGLSALVVYLREKDRNQSALDALTKRVHQSATTLRNSSTRLRDAVNQNTPTNEGE